jgi:hypothetical protein
MPVQGYCWYAGSSGTRVPDDMSMHVHAALEAGIDVACLECTRFPKHACASRLLEQRARGQVMLLVLCTLASAQHPGHMPAKTGNCKPAKAPRQLLEPGCACLCRQRI